MGWKLKAKIPPFKKIVEAITRVVHSRYEEIIDDLVDEIAQSVIDKLEQTTDFWHGGDDPDGTGSKQWPQPTFEVRVTKRSREKYDIVVDTDSWLWIWLDQGLPGHVSRGETFTPRPENRTIQESLRVLESATFADHPITVPAGEWIDGIDPRGWSGVIVDEIEAEYGDRVPGLTLSISIKKV